MDEAEVKVKMGLDDVQLRAGIASTKDKFESAMQQIKSSIEPVHKSLKIMRELLHGAGIFAAISAAGHLKEIFTEVANFIGGEASHAAEEIKKLDESLKSIEEQRKGIANRKFDKEMEGKSHEERIDAINSEMEGQQGRVEGAKTIAQMDRAVANAVKKRLTDQYGKFAVEHDLDLLKQIKDTEEAAQKSQLDFEKQKEKLSDLNAKKAQEEIDQNMENLEFLEKQADAEKKIADEIKKATEAAFQLGEAMDREMAERVKAIQKIKDTAANEFMPSHNDIINSGFTDRHGRFHTSEAAQMQSDIDSEKEAFMQDRLSGRYAGDQAGALNEVNYIEGMQKQLNQYLGGDSKTTAEKIAEATQKSEEHLGKIVEEFNK